MPKDRENEIRLPSLDELFSSQKERDEAHLKKIFEIPLDQIDPFPNHPYKVIDDDETEITYEESGFVPDYSDLYQDEFQASWYSPAMVNDQCDFYSTNGEYICSIPSGTYVQPLESIGRSGDIT